MSIFKRNIQAESPLSLPKVFTAVSAEKVYMTEDEYILNCTAALLAGEEEEEDAETEAEAEDQEEEEEVPLELPPGAPPFPEPTEPKPPDLYNFTGGIDPCEHYVMPAG